MMKFIFNGILLLAAVGIFFLYIKVQYTDDTTKSIQVLQKTKQDLVTTRSNLTELVNRQKTLQANRNNISEQQLSRLNTMLPETINPVLFIMELDTLAKAQAMSIKNIKFEPMKKAQANAQVGAVAVKKELYETFSVSFDVTGSYANFYEFMTNIEKGLRITDISSIVVTANDKVDVYQYTVKAQTYSMK